MDMTPNRARMQDAATKIIHFLQVECEAERLTHAEALASLASTLGLLLNTTDDQHRAKAVEMCDGIMTDILSTPLPVPRTA